MHITVEIITICYYKMSFINMYMKKIYIFLVNKLTIKIYDIYHCTLIKICKNL